MIEQTLRRPGHYPHLDSLRGLAALGVVFHHAHYEAEPVGSLAPAFAWMRQGHFLVTFFIILSGFCLTLPTVETGRLRTGVLRFLARRARRLLPPYYAALGASLLLIFTLIDRPTGRHWDFALPVTTESVVTHLLLVHNYEFADFYKINHVFWSIAVEWQIYFAFPVLLWLNRAVGVWWTTSLAIGLGYAGYFLLVGSLHAGLTPHFYGMFALGMLASELTHGSRWASTRADVSWWTLAALGVVAMVVLRPSVDAQVIDLPFGVACLASLVALSKPCWARRRLEWGPLVALGAFSYSLYLVHAPVQHLIVEYGFWRWGVPLAWEFPLLMLAGTPVIIGLSYLFFLAFERPFLATRPARSKSEPAASIE